MVAKTSTRTMVRIRLGQNRCVHRSEPWTAEPAATDLAEIEAFNHAWGQSK